MRFRSLICSAIGLLQFLFIASAFADFDSTYLQQNVHASGGIYHDDDRASAHQSTVQSILALQALGESIDATPHLAFVEVPAELTTTALVNVIKIKRYANINLQENIFSLRARQNLDGGFGSYLGYGSTPLDTAHALEALGFANHYDHQLVSRAALYLLDHQNADGGWSLHSNESSIFVTSSVLAGLRYFTQSYDLNSALEYGRTWLLSQKAENGSYGSNLETAYALLGIIPLTIDTTLYSDSLSQLIGAQSVNLSWDSDTYTTAVVLQALSLSQSLTLPSAPSHAYIQGFLIDRVTGNPIQNALVSTTGTQTLTNAQGEFGLHLTTTGSYPITFTANGYDSVTTTLNLPQIRNINFGELNLTPNPSNNVFASLQGTVTNKLSGQAITDATISLSGNKVYTGTTRQDGRYVVSVDEQGDYQLTVESIGYHSSSFTVSLSAGEHFEFSPVLIPVGEPNDVDVSLSAVIVDGDTGASLANVTVDLIQSGVSTLLISGANGQIQADQLEQGEVTLRIDHIGYQPITATALMAPGQNTFGQSIELFPVDPSAFYTTVRGKILDAALGLPLQGVEISLSGPDSKLSSTDANGDFTVQINAAGQYDLMISKAGYLPLNSTIQIELGQKLTLNTSMNLEGSETPIEIKLFGQAVDDITGEVIVEAKLTLSNDSQVLEGFTDSEGNWLIENIPSGNLTLSFSAPGYVSQNASVFVTPGSHVDIGQIAMSLLPTTSTLSGLVLDQQTGEPLAGAQVSLPGVQLSTMTDSTGAFEISDIPELSFDIVVTAPGYVTNARTLQLTQHQHVTANLSIEAVPENEMGIGIRSSVSDQLSYGAYEKALINVDLYNHDDVEKELWFVLRIEQAGVVLQETPIGHLALPNDIADSQILLAANTESLAVQFEWLTQNYTPGEYQLVLNAIDLQTRQQLVSSQAHVTIESTARMNGFEASVSPKFSNYEASEQIALAVKLTHASNETMDVEINFEFLDPAGTSLRSGVLPVTLQAGAKTAVYALDDFAQLIAQSGKYRLRVDSSLNGDILSSEAVLEVAPKVRVNAEMTVTPERIIPDGTVKKIHVELKLTGKNEG